MTDLDPDHVAMAAAQLHAMFHPHLKPLSSCSVKHRRDDGRLAEALLIRFADAGYQLTSKENA